MKIYNWFSRKFRGVFNPSEYDGISYSIANEYSRLKNTEELLEQLFSSQYNLNEEEEKLLKKLHHIYSQALDQLEKNIILLGAYAERIEGQSSLIHRFSKAFKPLERICAFESLYIRKKERICITRFLQGEHSTCAKILHTQRELPPLFKGVHKEEFEENGEQFFSNLEDLYELEREKRIHELKNF